MPAAATGWASNGCGITVPARGVRNDDRPMGALTDLSATLAAIFDCELHSLRAALRGIARPHDVLNPDRRRSRAPPADD